MPQRILISADMEGATGAVTASDVIRGSATWAAVRESWAQDINAVTAALFEHGTDEVLITDAHADGCNLEPGLIDGRAALIRGSARRFGMLEGIDDGVQAVVFLGYHGGPGSGGVLCHAFMTSGIHSIRVNGRPAGEGTINALLAAHFCAPVVLVSGDDVACEEAARYAPDAQRVMVKRALGRYLAQLRPAAEVRQELAAAAGEAMKRLRSAPPAAEPEANPGPELCAKIEFSSEACALAVTAIPAVRQEGPRLVSYTAADVPQWYRCLGAIWTLARAAQGGTYG